MTTGTRSDSLASAVACAEHFVRLNGYTDWPASADTTLLSSESIEWGASWVERLSLRANTLPDRARFACPSGPVKPGYTVVFVYPKDTTRGRAVTSLLDLTELRMMHQDVNLAFIRSEQSGCHPLAISAR